VSAAPSPVKLAAPLTCPECEHEVTGSWTADQRTANQRCGNCGHVFAARWPGFRFQAETVIARPSEEPGHVGDDHDGAAA